MNSKKQLNTDKTEVMAVGTSSHLVDSDSADIGGSNILFITSVKIDQTFSLLDQISSVFPASFFK